MNLLSKPTVQGSVDPPTHPTPLPHHQLLRLTPGHWHHDPTHPAPGFDPYPGPAARCGIHAGWPGLRDPGLGPHGPKLIPVKSAGHRDPHISKAGVTACRVGWPGPCGPVIRVDHICKGGHGSAAALCPASCGNAGRATIRTLPRRA